MWNGAEPITTLAVPVFVGSLVLVAMTVIVFGLGLDGGAV
jgi:hypothetical protein